MKRKTLALLSLSSIFALPAVANNSVESMVALLSGGEQVEYRVIKNPSAELNLQSIEYPVLLPSGTQYTLQFEHNEVSEVTGTLFLRDKRGEVRGSISVSRNGLTQGFLATPEGAFNLISRGNELIIMESKLPSGLSEEAEQELLKHSRQQAGALALPAKIAELGAVSHSQQQTLRLSLYYTNDVANFLAEIGADPKQYFEFYIDETNQAYKNSDVNVSIEIANVTSVDYNEYNPFITAVDFWLSEGENLNKLKFLFPDADYIWDNNSMDEELKQSKKYGSDMDMLITNLLEGYCGIARTIGAEVREQSMAVTNIHCLQRNTLSHEMGHLFGAEHNWEATAEVPFRAQYAHGYYDAQDWTFRTIMSYSCISSAKGPKECPRINYFSTPRKEFNNKYIGTADEHDNARQHNDWAPLLTNLSQGADCQQFTQWHVNKAYKKGTEVVHGGAIYRANWWSYNDDPSITSSNSEWQEVWKRMTVCQ
ncbi:hypothetical protein PSECIP111854_00934 [Pseudoalteromonas sp. CIP111854]|uniref:Chitin-binding type-3 domain-containing protein n=1 Tax=Pseudoalteromonas holothuriae TaxID=2963714 RepID=A0A9W4QT64_9GAMM|nr:M12 family metallo-peptidase [Pseudoalteromonas sp. CIP111854]CAH9052277.1 hypothetical protein PSECIP111854_00934 [Pseudoalteromonas sp. CIP111854]